MEKLKLRYCKKLFLATLCSILSLPAFSASYPCYQVISDFENARNGHRTPEIISRISAMSKYMEEDDEMASRIIRMARRYYGGDASNEEVKRFGAKVGPAMMKVCKSNPSMEVKDAMIKGAEVLAGYSSPSSTEYRTEQFRTGKSAVSTLYICVVVGDKEGFADDSFTILSTARRVMEIDAELSGDLLHDAFTWYQNEKDSMDLYGMWNGMCETPMDNLRKMGR